MRPLTLTRRAAAGYYERKNYTDDKMAALHAKIVPAMNARELLARFRTLRERIEKKDASPTMTAILDDPYPRSAPPVRLATSATILAASASISASVMVRSRGWRVTAIATDFLPGAMPCPS